MKAIFLRILHFLKLDVLLLRVLEKLLASLTKKREAFASAISCFVCCRITATEDEPSTIA